MIRSNRTLLRLPRAARAWLAAGAIALAAALPVRAGADTIELGWTAPGDDGTTGRAAAYELRYAATPISGADTLGWWNGATSAGVLPPPLTAGSAERFTVIGLTTGTTYYFAIRTADEVPNWSGFSNVSVRQAGAPGGPLATPADFSAGLVTGGVRLSWTEPASGAGEGYHVYRRTAGGASPDTLLATLAVVQTACIDSSVVGGTAYEYRVATYQGSTEGTPAVASISVPVDQLIATTSEVHGYPNPARDHVTLRFRAGTADGQPGRVRVVIFDLTGRRISQLLDDVLPAGEQAIEWVCRSDAGQAVAPGIYNVIVDAPTGRSVTQLAILP
ncbi:MAG TPA: hypothetical protein VLT84_02895 [Acidobacteriota bacterium]|nr:hypothetical protein [Acidobacteriota bacterium]